MRILPCLLLLAACDAPQQQASNRWDDERLWPVLEAQEHRDTRALCALLNDTSAMVREAAALAFASVQDTSSAPCLLGALEDEAPSVRATAAFALGFVSDSARLSEMTRYAMNERDSVVHRALINASFIAKQRSGMLEDVGSALDHLDRSRGHECARAADALRRMPDSLVYNAANGITERLAVQETDARQFLILAMRKLSDRANPALVGAIAEEATRSNERVNALRVLNAIEPEDGAVETLLASATGPVEQQAVLEAISTRERLDARVLMEHVAQVNDTTMRIGLLGLVIKHGDAAIADSAGSRLRLLATGLTSPYLRAAVLMANGSRVADLDEMLALMKSDEHPAIRQAAFQTAIASVREIMARSRHASREAQFAELSNLISAVISTNDAGLISAAAEVVEAEESEVIGILLLKESEQRAIRSLQPIRDLEAIMLLRKAAAKRDGLPPPAHERPAFNHPINKEKLRGLKQGQRYRIVTNKGEIVIATDVNECPGSSLAFDSLVTTGYYNGKAFHRMVPNFVVQGGCPRGDGYGGMPWTMRTEIGRTPFKAGSVGLASAGPDTESCQFFITHSATPHLDGRYTRFGEVVSGMEVVWQLQVGDVMERVERSD